MTRKTRSLYLAEPRPAWRRSGETPPRVLRRRAARGGRSLSEVELFAVRLREEEGISLLDTQRDALRKPWCRYLSPGRDGAFTRFLCWAETTCLDAALLDLVLAVPPAGQYANRLIWREYPSPSGKSDAGWPDEVWHPQGEFDEAALDRIRSRTIDPTRGEDSVVWARLTIAAWWSLAATFCPGATVVDILGDGQPVTDLPPASAGPIHGPASFGTLLPLTPQPQSETPCDVTAHVAVRDGRPRAEGRSVPGGSMPLRGLADLS